MRRDRASNLSAIVWFISVILAAGFIPGGCDRPLCTYPLVYDYGYPPPTVKQIENCSHEDALRIPMARANVEPSTPTAWPLCPEPLFQMDENRVFYCANQAFWNALTDGRRQYRENAEDFLTKAIARTKKSSASKRKSWLYNSLGDLRMAMAIENGSYLDAILGDTRISEPLRKAVELDPDNHAASAFLNSMLIAIPAMTGDWETAVLESEAAIEEAKQIGPDSFYSIAGTIIGFPLDTGLPNRIVRLSEEIPCDFCDENTTKAPFTMPGMRFYIAEAYFRVGEFQRGLEEMEKVPIEPGYEQWPFHHIVDGILEDPQAFSDKWAQFGTDRSAVMDAFTNQNFGCVFCHGRP